MSDLPGPVRRLADLLQEIRRRFSDLLPVQAIPWIRFKHPIHPVQTELAEQPDRRVRVSLEAVLLPIRFFRCLLTAIHMTLQLAFIRLRLRRFLSMVKKERFDLVVKTWAYPESLLPGLQDFYYGDFQQRLLKEGVKTLLLAGKPTEMGWLDFAKASATASTPFQLPEVSLVPLTAPVRSVFLQMGASLRVFKEAAGMRDPFNRQVFFRVSRDCLSPAVMAISLYYWIGREAVRRWHPKAVIALYEGSGWEQCFWHGAKKADPICKTVGYQHTILLRHNLALLEPERKGERRPHPDTVLCLGPRTEEMLRPSHLGCDLFLFGTFRQVPASSSQMEPSPEKKTVLVLPEGYMEEAVLLFNAALQAARDLPDHRFILRSHPVLPMEEILPRLRSNPADLLNVRMSRGKPIEEDFASSSVVLYRGSSSVLYAILHGLKPVYFSNGRFPELDPLFELDAWRETVSSIEALEQFLRRYASTDSRMASDPWRSAAGYAASYAIPVRENSIGRLLAGLHIGQGEVFVA